MDRQNLVPILVTILLATLLTYVFLQWDSSSSREVQDTKVQPVFSGNLQILVAAENITLGKKLSHTDLQWQTWPKETLANEYTVKNTRKLDHFLGMIVRKPITKGEPIVASQIIQPSNRNVLAAIIKPGMRAVSLEVNESTGVAGFIFPGDYVDLTATVETKEQTMSVKVQTIAKNILVVAIDQTTSRDASDIAKIVKTITVEATPEVVTKIITAKTLGNVSISLQGLLE